VIAGSRLESPPRHADCQASVGLVTIPQLLPGHAQLRPAIESLHKFLANALVIVAALHAWLRCTRWPHYGTTSDRRTMCCAGCRGG